MLQRQSHGEKNWRERTHLLNCLILPPPVSIIHAFTQSGTKIKSPSNILKYADDYNLKRSQHGHELQQQICADVKWILFLVDASACLWGQIRHKNTEEEKNMKKLLPADTEKTGVPLGFFSETLMFGCSNKVKTIGEYGDCADLVMETLA